MAEPVPMRRRDRALSEAEALALLQKAEWGVLATADAAGTPLATPLSYVLLDGVLYFHCAKSGHKLANIDARPQVCFMVVGATRPVFEKGDYSTFFESAVVHGTAARVADEAERRTALRALCEKYLPGSMHGFEAAMARSGGVTEVVRITIGRVSGKAKRPKPEQEAP